MPQEPTWDDEANKMRHTVRAFFAAYMIFHTLASQFIEEGMHARRRSEKNSFGASRNLSSRKIDVPREVLSRLPQVYWLLVRAKTYLEAVPNSTRSNIISIKPWNSFSRYDKTYISVHS